MNNINIPLKKIYSLLTLIFLFYLTLLNSTNSAEKIGTIVNLTNEVHAINVAGEKRLLDLYDDVFLQDEVLTNNLSIATVQYNDNSTVIVKKSSSFKVTDFNISGLKDVFFGKVERGSVIIESGKIAKKFNGSMIIKLPTMNLEIKGTRFSIQNNPDGTSEVSLAEDSFGEVGVINISSENEVKTLFDTEQVVFINNESNISERVKTDIEKEELSTVDNELVKASSIDENLIQIKLEEKLLLGNLEDANNDGVINFSDIDAIKESIKTTKKEKIDFIVENSTENNTKFLSEVLNNSDNKSIGQSIESILEKNEDLISSVVINLISKDNTFLTSSDSEFNNVIKEKIYTQMLTNSNDVNNNITVLGDIITKGDAKTVNLIINTIQEIDEITSDTNIALKVLSSVANTTTNNEIKLETEQKKLVNELIETAVISANGSKDDALLLANVISNSDLETNEAILNSISNDTNSTLGAEVLSNLADLDETNTIFTDAETVDQLNNFVDVIASTNLINPASNDQKNVEYDQNGFDLSEPFFNKDTGTAYNLEGFDKNGYNSAGYNKSGFNNAMNYNSSYEANVSPS